MKRKLLALLLALVMVLSLLPAALVPDTAVAEEKTPLEEMSGGAILHCFDWSYKKIIDHLEEIAAAGYTAVQTSPVQPPKDYNAAWTDGGGQWWKLYQPLGFRIAGAGETWLVEDGVTLADLCEAAHDKHIKVIVDVVANHLANKEGGGYYLDKDGNGSPDDLNGDGEINALDANLSEQVDDAFQNHPEYFHANTAGVNDGSRYNMTQNQMGMPDLNTSNQFVQQTVYDFLVECVNCGVDGFRFDAAKHIELPGDSSGKSDFWSAILDGVDDGGIQGVRNVANKELFIYGESLSGGSNESWVKEYETYMALTDSDYGGRIRSAIGGTNAGMLGDGRYVRCEDARGNVVWVESHDTYEDGGSVWLTDDQIIKAWAIVGARADSTALFFARPNDVMGAASSDTTWKSTAVTEVNQFKNHYSYTSGEYLHNDYGSKVTWIERGVKNNGAGVVISKLDGAGAVNLDMEFMSDGTYEDSVSGNIFYVSGGKLHGLVGNTGVAVVYKTSDAQPPSPYISAKTLYLKPEGWWTDDGARFAMYLYGDSPAVWVNMYAVGDGYYEAAVPEGKWTGVIFGRMNPNTTQNSFENGVCWNQTEDLFPVVGTDCYKRTGDEGEWMKYPNPLGGYYLVGNMNGWAIHPDYKLVRNTADEYMINCDLSVLSRCKVVYTENGTDITTWYPDSDENTNDFGAKGEITKNGNYNIYFRPGGNDEWSYKYIYAALQTEASGSENAGFYLVGTMTNWKVKAAYKLNGSGNEYSIDKHLSVMDQFKVVYSADGAETSIWYPDPSPNYGADDATRIIGSGVYHISFRPNYDGGEGWFNNCIKVSGCPVTVNIVGNSDLIEWTLYKSENGNNDEWTSFGGDEENWIPLENGDNVVPVGWEVGLEAKTTDNNAVEYDCEISYTNSDGEGEGASGGDTNSKFRASVGPLGEGPVTITLTVGDEVPAFDNYSVVLSGQIGMNFYMTIPEEYIDTNTNPEVTFTIAADEKSRTTTAIGKKLDDGRYRFTCYLTSVEMTDQITAVYNYEVDGEPMTASMETSIQGYLNKIIENKENDPEFTRAHDLAKALWTYGYYAHDAVTDGPNHKQMDIGNVNMINDPSIVGFDLTVIKGSEVAKITYSLSLDSETALNIYLTPAEGVAFTKDNVIVRKETEIYENYIVEKVGARYRVKITGIGAHELGTGFNVDVGTRANTTISNVSVVSIVKKYLANNTIKTETKNAATALYYYYQAAIAY